MRLTTSNGVALLIAAAIVGWVPAESTERQPAPAMDRAGMLLANSAPIERQVDAMVNRQSNRILNAGSTEAAPLRPLYPVDFRDSWGTADLHAEDQPLASVEVDAPKGVKESTAAPDDVPLGLAALAWAAQRPGDAWRLLMPISR